MSSRRGEVGLFYSLQPPSPQQPLVLIIYANSPWMWLSPIITIPGP